MKFINIFMIFLITFPSLFCDFDFSDVHYQITPLISRLLRFDTDITVLEGNSPENNRMVVRPGVGPLNATINSQFHTEDMTLSYTGLNTTFMTYIYATNNRNIDISLTMPQGVNYTFYVKECINHTIVASNKSVASGVYFYRLSDGDRVIA